MTLPQTRSASVASAASVGRAATRRLLLVRGLRALADGFVSVLLPIYLGVLGMSPLQVGIIVTGTLLGSGQDRAVRDCHGEQ